MSSKELIHTESTLKLVCPTLRRPHQLKRGHLEDLVSLIFEVM